MITPPVGAMRVEMVLTEEMETAMEIVEVDMGAMVVAVVAMVVVTVTDLAPI